MNDGEKFNVGYKLGRLIFDLFVIIAAIDSIPVKEVIDHWVSAYVGERIQEGGD